MIQFRKKLVASVAAFGLVFSTVGAISADIGSAYAQGGGGGNGNGNGGGNGGGNGNGKAVSAIAKDKSLKGVQKARAITEAAGASQNALDALDKVIDKLFGGDGN